MTTLEERARRAAEALRAAVAAQEVAPMEEPEPRRRWHARLLIAAAMITLLAVVVTVVARDNPPPIANEPRVVRAIDVPVSSEQVVVAPDGTLWVSGGCADNALVPERDHCRNVQHVDGLTGRIIGATAVSGSAHTLAYAAGSIWVGGGDSIARLDGSHGQVLHRWQPRGVDPTDIVEAYGDVWVLDAEGDRVLRIDPTTNRVTTVELRTRALGLVEAEQMLVANDAIVIVSRCCGASPEYAQIGTVNKAGAFSTFFSSTGRLTVASDGTDLWVGTRKGSLTRYAASGITRKFASWFVDLDAHYDVRPGLLFATQRSVWSVAPDDARPQRVDVRNKRVDAPIEFTRGPINLAYADIAVDRDHPRAWVLDGARGVVYEIRD